MSSASHSHTKSPDRAQLAVELFIVHLHSTHLNIQVSGDPELHIINICHVSPMAWLQPPVSLGSCHPAQGQKRPWEQPPVAHNFLQSLVLDGATVKLEKCWLQPPLAHIATAASPRVQSPVGSCAPQAHPTATIDLALTTILVATAMDSAEIAARSKIQAARLTPILHTPCRGRDPAGCQPCTRCAGTPNSGDAAHFCALFSSMPRADQVQLFSGLYYAATSGNAADQVQTSPLRTKWRFLGQPVCVQRLTQILGISSPTLYKRNMAADYFLQSKFVFCSCCAFETICFSSRCPWTYRSAVFQWPGSDCSWLVSGPIFPGTVPLCCRKFA